MNTIIESLDRAIQSGEYPPNTRLPSERDLARRFGVPVSLARAAMLDLAERGVVHRIERGGTFVNGETSDAVTDDDAFALRCINFIEPVRKRMDPFAFALADTLHGYTRALQQHPLRVRFVSLSVEGMQFEELLNAALPRQGQGCVIGDILDTALMEWLNEEGIPFVIRRHSYYDIRPYPPHHGVYLNRNGASHAAVLHLMKRGHRRIGYMGQLTDDERRSQWGMDWVTHHDGYRAAFCVKGLPLPVHYEADVRGDSLHAATVAALRLLRMDERPTALVCQNDLIAFGVMAAAKECGLRIPDELSVMGFDNDPAGAETDPPLTTFGGHEELAVAAMERLFAIAEGEVSEPGVEPVECPLIVRGSTGRAVGSV